MNIQLPQITPRLSKVGAGLIAGFALMSAPALQAAEPKGYVTDSSGEIVKNSFGDCVHTSAWTPSMAIMECEPKLARANMPEPETEVAAMEPEPEPEPVMRRINLSSDAYFAFDKAELTAEGKQKLDELARQMNNAQEPSIRIVGHTDRIGPEDYNMKLSRERAQAVKDYLSQKGVPEDVMSVAGKGEADPIERCDGLRGNALIDCLQPNRRTDIEFSAFEVVEQPRQ